VRGCLNKIPKMRPTYAMLLRQAWLSPLMQPPTISEDEEAEAAAEAGDALPGGGEGASDAPSTADKEVAEWVKAQMERKREGKMKMAKKPALHEAPLDAVPGSPLMGRDEAPSNVDGEGKVVGGDAQTGGYGEIKPNPGVRVNSPELIEAQIEPVDFASVGSSPDEKEAS
jgi:hypothetical protein